MKQHSSMFSPLDPCFKYQFYNQWFSTTKSAYLTQYKSMKPNLRISDALSVINRQSRCIAGFCLSLTYLHLVKWMFICGNLKRRICDEQNTRCKIDVIERNRIAVIWVWSSIPEFSSRIWCRIWCRIFSNVLKQYTCPQYRYLRITHF